MLDNHIDVGQYGTVETIEAGEWDLDAYLDDMLIGRITPSRNGRYTGESFITGAWVESGNTIADVAYNLAYEAYR